MILLLKVKSDGFLPLNTQGFRVRRVADGKGFRCSGYENCSDNSTLWVFHNDNGTEENLIYRAQISNEVISYFCMT